MGELNQFNIQEDSELLFNLSIGSSMYYNIMQNGNENLSKISTSGIFNMLKASFDNVAKKPSEKLYLLMANRNSIISLLNAFRIG